MRSPDATVVTLESGKRYSVFLQHRADGQGFYARRVSVWFSGAHNRAGHWRGIDPLGKVGEAATAAAIESHAPESLR